MDQDVCCKAQILPLSRHPLHHVTTYLLCRNNLLRAGIAQLLAGSQFALSGDASAGVPNLSALDDNLPTLILICESLSPEGYGELVGELKSAALAPGWSFWQMTSSHRRSGSWLRPV